MSRGQGVPRSDGLIGHGHKSQEAVNLKRGQREVALVTAQLPNRAGEKKQVWEPDGAAPFAAVDKVGLGGRHYVGDSPLGQGRRRYRFPLIVPRCSPVQGLVHFASINYRNGWIDPRGGHYREDRHRFAHHSSVWKRSYSSGSQPTKGFVCEGLKGLSGRGVSLPLDHQLAAAAQVEG